MSDQRRHPDDEEVEHSGERHPPGSGGALTGATESLTSGGFGTEPCVPGELREIEDPTRAGRMTDALARHAGHEQEAAASRLNAPDASPRASGSRRDDSDTYAEGEEHL